MAISIFAVMIILLLLGFPMMVPLIAGSLIGFVGLFGGLGQLDTMVQQILGGIQPASLIAVPM
ncbi:TRAP transporter large permease, partial [Cribrihabitans sp. XS_ASV171]